MFFRIEVTHGASPDKDLSLAGGKRGRDERAFRVCGRFFNREEESLGVWKNLKLRRVECIFSENAVLCNEWDSLETAIKNQIAFNYILCQSAWEKTISF